MRQQAPTWLHAMKKLLLLLLLLPALAFAQSDFEETKALAEQGNADAQYNLGLIYDLGNGVPENDAEAVRWYRLAAEQGHAIAQYRLGGMYYSGTGVPQNDMRAYVWWSVSAAQGAEAARFNRDIAVGRLSSAERARAQDLATKCFESDFKDCPF
jgi:TPR repeat protein